MSAGARAACSRMERHNIRMRRPARSRSPAPLPGLSPAVAVLPIPEEKLLGRVGIGRLGRPPAMKPARPESPDGACRPAVRSCVTV